ncbi:uncharacterized protein DUF4038 [Paenibacillus taihuensis]|uniref:Uncharacterized protein DUF4038 n=1 Tax=Paenibacillus taihuensis TaxID=1156355 RepID=A0A3D9S3W8_9BACL|nr:DUF4038 domain-containing protein [Paenibacillus taihuensis]REE87478.1 uncharacterized protein DUF4038 [Paenibacillus taihuensis]
MRVTFQPNDVVVECFDFYEVTIDIVDPTFHNPFTEVEVFGLFGEDKAPFTWTYDLPDNQIGKGSNSDYLIPVDGFCDSPDGSVFRIRFMPRSAGSYIGTIVLKYQGKVWSHEEKFEVRDAGRRGPLRVDPEHPFHFQWEGTGEHFFYNAMTTYHLLGIRRDEEINRTIDRFHISKVNRLRVLINSCRWKNAMLYSEPVYESDDFTFLYGPWIAERPDNHANPGWDETRFDVGYWQKIERTLAYARDRSMIISIIMYGDAFRPGCDPFGKERMGGQDEQRYFRYAAARLSAYSNITWDLTNEYRLIRPHEWVERMGYFLRSCDPYRHLISCHGHETFEFRTSGWADFAMYQRWDEFGGYDYMINNRNLQIETGRIIPQVNEEYGYEDHYPSFGGKEAPARSADTLRRKAWEIYMAGCYQTSGEYAGSGLGGWVNGRGDDSMTLLNHYAPIVTFFENCEWWRTTPDNSLIDNPGCYCLADPGGLYIVYSPVGQEIRIKLASGSYGAIWFHPKSGVYGERRELASNGEILTISCPDHRNDMVLQISAVTR